MEANELRIGNFIKFPFNENPIIVSIAVIKYCFDDSKMYDPIPLTKEWLMKFGFEKDFYRINDSSVAESFIEDYVWRLEDEIHLSYRDGVWWLMDEYDSLLSFKRQMKGVHDLQNLFFALKGKELTLGDY